MTTPAPTFADTLDALARHPELASRTKADLQSAVRCFCRVLGLDPAATAAGDLAALQERLGTVRAENSSLSPKRWSVIRSQVLRALELTGVAKPLRTAAVPLTPAWEQMLADVPGQGPRAALSRFARFSSQQEIAPAEVTPETFERFGKALKTGSLVRNPDKVCRDAATAWARLAAAGGLPTPSEGVVLPSRPARKPGRHPLMSFPVAFQEDLDAFRRWCVTADPLDEQARPKAYRSQTVTSYSSNLHTAADAAVRSGLAIGEVTSIRVLARPEVFLAILRQLLADAEGKATAHVHGVATTLPVIARDWLRLPPEQIAELKRHRAKLPKLRPGLTDKNRALLAAFDDQALLARFLRLEDDLWKEALSERLAKNQRLVRAQMALLIGILQITPLRRKNICGVAFGTHITWPNGPTAPALIQAAAPETKTSVDYVGELPLALSRKLHHYRTRLAPALTGVTPTRLFIKMDGAAKRQESVTNRLEVALRKRLGIHMTAHQFRHLAGKLMLDANPGAYEAVAQLLGHAGTKTVMRFYAGPNPRRATRFHAALIEKLREETRLHGKRRRKTEEPV